MVEIECALSYGLRRVLVVFLGNAFQQRKSWYGGLWLLCQHDRWSDIGGVSQGGDREELCR